ncbi:MAG: phosphoenolpyruvate mutase [Candidatus Pacebacteria bacterium]|nr:phosphoenolpyruvate mutase [Candidatus Paceibacterota bacterium]MBP9772371.1 phosphoenolpyruvate mutase [Candidatus Paceibacterota bacterium]
MKNSKKTSPKNKKEKIVYLPMAVDLIHIGHITIINEAKNFGRVVVGLLTDKAIARYKRVPLASYDQRKKVIESIVGVSEVVKQDDDDYVSIIRKIKPDYFIHGDDWKTGIQKEKRDRVIQTMKEWGGVVIDSKRKGNKGISSSKLNDDLNSRGTTPERRGAMLRRIMEVKPIVRILEVHNGLTGRIVEKAKIEKNEEIKEFDGMWLSSLTDSVSKGKPDNGSVDFSSRQNTIDQIFEVTTKPMIVDADNGGYPEHFALMVKTLERLGVSIVIIEDKVGLKANSLFGTDVDQTQDSIKDFSHKISLGKKSQVGTDFMIVARIESLILKKGMKDALARAKAYIEAGADGILIHSKEKTPDEIFTFCKEYKKFKKKVPIFVVPSTYSSVTEAELIKHGVKVVIYANHLLRSAYPAMVKTAETILENNSCKEAEKDCMSIKEILTLIPGGGE